MKKFFALVCVLATVGALSAQTRTPADFPGYFPEAAEIDASSRTFVAGFEDAAGLAKVADGRLVSDVGFTRYERVDYSAASALSIEVFTLLDSLAAYSLLTLLREDNIRSGPPGDAFAIGNGGFLFAQGRFFVRILVKDGKGASKELLEKSAEIVGSKMAPSSGERPGLLEYFPSDGYDASSLRYFPSLDAYKTWTRGKASEYIVTNHDMEIATARYFAGDRSGTFSLLRLPTPELAEEYYDELSASMSALPDGLSIYAKHAGPLVAILEGNFDSVPAAGLLSGVRFSYSLRWVDGDENNARTVWGVPGAVLSAVVYSVFFSFIAIFIALIIGLAIGIGRFALRQRKEKRYPDLAKEDAGSTWLNLR